MNTSDYQHALAAEVADLKAAEESGYYDELSVTILTSAADPLFTAYYPMGTHFEVGQFLAASAGSWEHSGIITDIQPSDDDSDTIIDIYIDPSPSLQA